MAILSRDFPATDGQYTLSSYIGSELELFAGATHWKNYWGSRLKPFVRGRVLDVGAGIGASIDTLGNTLVDSWLALEPDPLLANQITTNHVFPVRVESGHINAISGTFNTILYIDVLEHIERDGEELRQAAARLEPGGHLVVLAPAHMQLFSEWDRAIGHYRRYNRQSLLDTAPETLRCVRIEYLDSVGMLASWANRLLLRQSSPEPGQLRFWDKMMVPCSRLLDPMIGRRLGKTIIAVWENRP